MIPHRVLYVLKIFPKLSETFIASELAELCRRGIEVRIVSMLPAGDGPWHEFIIQAGLDRLTNYQPEAFSTLVNDFRPQFIHAHFATESTELARSLAAERGIPFTFTAHGYDIHRKPPADFAARASAASAVITVSKANAVYIAKEFGVPEAHIHTIPCGVDLERFRPENGSLLRSGTPLLVCVARHVPVKNLALLLQSCALLRQWNVDFRCVLVGEGRSRAQLETKRVELGLQDIVEMPGAAEQAQVLAWWRKAAVGVLTSDNEGMPVSLMEAAACGVPVVATEVGGIPELVQHGVTGLLSPAGDVRGIATALKTLLTDSELRARMSLAARRRAEEVFSLKTQVDRLLALWSGILEQ